MAGLDWDRARWDRIRSERGTERLDLPSQRRAKPAAPKAERDANITRWKREFATLPYDAQLQHLTVLRRRLRRLYGDDDAAAAAIATHFKPLLTKSAAQSTSPARSNPSARIPSQPRLNPPARIPSRPRLNPPARSKPGRKAVGSKPVKPAAPVSTELSMAILAVIQRRSGELHIKQCVRLLAGTNDDAALAGDVSFGACAGTPPVEIRRTLHSLLQRRWLRLGPQSRLVIGDRDSLRPSSVRRPS